MPRLTSEHFIERTSELLATHCGSDVSLAVILKECDAQKGSLYHFFPGGKDELFVATVDKMAGCATRHISKCMEESTCAATAISKHIRHIAQLMERADRPIGLPFTAMAAIYGENCPAVRDSCEAAISNVQSIIAKRLVQDGFTSHKAKSLGLFSILSIDGAILLSNSRGHAKPLRIAANHLAELLSFDG
ncbi:MAG: TetR/AcrR family transcriptional regulator [Planctomycetota bacterium]